MSGSEFDRYAATYDAGYDNLVKRMAGRSPDQFTAVKVRWLLQREPALVGSGLRLLDFGCGIGDLLRVLAEQGAKGSFTGCDVSQGMLEEARRRWPSHLDPAPAWHQQQGATPFVDGAFDVAVASAVLHHVAPARRPEIYRELGRVIRPGGRLYIFEHNPRNPLVRYVVAKTPIDRDAVLLAPEEVRQGLLGAGRYAIDVHYMMFLPPRITFLSGLDRALAWLPLGAQYAVTARKPDPI